MPQGSVFGPILFIIYTADLALIFVEHGLLLHNTPMTVNFTDLVGPQMLLHRRLSCPSNNMFTNDRCYHGNELIMDLTRITSANDKAHYIIAVRTSVN